MPRRNTLSTVTFSPSANRYRGANGRFISRGKILNLVDNEQSRLNNKLQNRFSRYLSNTDTLIRFERNFIKLMKESLIRVSLFGHGGLENFNSRYVALKTKEIEREIRDEFNIFFRLVGFIEKGNLSEAQIRDRLNRLSRKVLVRFNQSELEAKILVSGHNVGERILDPTADHCPDCPALATNGEVSIEEIVAIGTACRCGGYCRCRIRTRRDPTKPDTSRTITFQNNILSKNAAMSVMLDRIANR